MMVRENEQIQGNGGSCMIVQKNTLSATVQYSPLFMSCIVIYFAHPNHFEQGRKPSGSEVTSRTVMHYLIGRGGVLSLSPGAHLEARLKRSNSMEEDCNPSSEKKPQF